MEKNTMFIEELDQIVKEWLLTFKTPVLDNSLPNLFISTDKSKYSEFVFLNMGSQLANQYKYETLLLDLAPYTPSFHSQMVDSSIETINTDDGLNPDNIKKVNKNLSLGLLYSDDDFLGLLAAKETQSLFKDLADEYDVVLVNSPQFNVKNKKVCQLLINTISNDLIIVKENLSSKREVRELTSLILRQDGKMGNIYVK
ncbi:hypothetical protein [Lactiplantibacillus mudanjiangensis]|uniref:Uncharacterized protein n=1 Tax=Lactiplantibacillus mudanjiangensis TaxID=1296538 RepID=A0A660E0X3_9LACO|nr:hypothetical protein [Lactiplantibacillus mudanjiangensis]VDG23453.1 hypothetical protein MUDAN_IGPPGNFN_02045 [Lactiplantibacillus mudanjiangensis]VDG29329.1 hypothetical protein MUDAN_MDHGFNIF_03465 [Lactiplantibacillus mudanjiangensis]